jgi:hypothetical protein
MVETVHATTSDTDILATADMAVIGFFFLCRPGEHTKNKTNTPFRLCDIRLFRNGNEVPWRDLYNTPSITQCDTATAASLTFTTQKNGVKGEVITHGMTGDPLFCPVCALVRRITAHSLAHTPVTMPICTYPPQHIQTRSQSTKRRFVTSRALTELLRMGVRLARNQNPNLPITESEIDARSLRASGATAMLCAGVDHTKIMLFGRWRSDAMIQYLHIQFDPVVRKFARKMLDEGDFANIPNELNWDGFVPLQTGDDE